nr:immunoglobulin light chain junction region [Macaca mulatta]
CMQTIEFPLTF